MSSALSGFSIVGGIPSNSASPTDVWILKQKSQLSNPNAKIYTMKLFPSSAMVRFIGLIVFSSGEAYRSANPLENAIYKSFEGTRNVELFTGMEYEIGVYKLIRDKLILPKVCTNFVEIFTPETKKEGASFKELVGGILSEGNRNDLVANFYDSVLFTLLEEKGRERYKDTRKSIVRESPRGSSDTVYDLSDRYRLKQVLKKLRIYDIASVDKIFARLFEDLRFNFVISEMAASSQSPGPDAEIRVLSLRDVLTKRYEQPKQTLVSESNSAAVVLQTFSACLAMGNVAKVFHNDLHDGNAFVEISKLPRSVRYRLVDTSGETVFDIVLTSKYKVKIFDFDRAYAKSLGKNPLVDYFDFCGKYHTCNEELFLPRGGMRRENIANMVSVAAWISGCGRSQENAGIKNLVSEVMAGGDPGSLLHSTAKADIQTLFKYTCVTNDSEYVDDAIDKDEASISVEMVTLETKTPIGPSKTHQHFFIGDESGGINLSKEIYDWEIFDEPEDILIKLSNAIGAGYKNSKDSTIEPYEKDKHSDLEFEFDLRMMRK